MVSQYFQKYKETIKNFSKIDKVLKQKQSGALKQSRRHYDTTRRPLHPKQQMYDANGFPLQDNSDYEGNAQGDEDLVKQRQYDKKALITYL